MMLELRHAGEQIRNTSKVFKCGGGKDHLDRLCKELSFTQSQRGKKSYIQGKVGRLTGLVTLQSHPNLHTERSSI
jgi:hypothetical protein